MTKSTAKSSQSIEKSQNKQNRCPQAPQRAAKASKRAGTSKIDAKNDAEDDKKHRKKQEQAKTIQQYYLCHIESLLIPRYTNYKHQLYLLEKKNQVK